MSPLDLAFPHDWERRDILRWLGGALALAGLDGCERQPDERALPYVEEPEGVSPGIARFYASAVEMDGVAQPILGRTRVGRPIKLEGNPDHPASLGATDAFTQAALLDLYDPERSTAPRQLGRITDWAGFDAMAAEVARRSDGSGGAGFRLLTGPVGSPTLLRQIEAMHRRWPQARWHVWSATDDLRGRALRATFGRPLQRRLRLGEAHAIVSFDDDLLGPGPFQTLQARSWTARRQSYQSGDGSALLFVAEPTPTLTGVTATDRLVASSDRIATLLVALAAELGLGNGQQGELNSRERAWLGAAAAALDANRGRSLLTVGGHHPPALQQLAFAVDARLGNLGHTAEFIPIERPLPVNEDSSLAALVADMTAGQVNTLLILDINPAYTAPPDLDFGAALAHVPLRIHAGLHTDETAALCQWHAPLAHCLESWSDGRAADGSAVVIQPLVRPFLNVRSRHALLASILGGRASDYDLVRETWDAPASEERWRQILLAGIVPDSRPSPVALGAPVTATIPTARNQRRLTLLIRPDPSIWDGSFASNPWLQELPKPISKLTWGNAVYVSPALARERGFEDGMVVKVSVGGASVTGPVWVTPGQERDTLLVHLGYGRRAGGRVATGIGFDATDLRHSTEPWRTGVTIELTGARETLAATQIRFDEGDEFIRTVAAAGTTLAPAVSQASEYPPLPRTRPSWGMAIDLDLCIGCNACVVACVAENNIPMVGKEQVAKGRHMHWLRVDRYDEGPPDAPRQGFQPVPCMHCENAPCEMGCPVNAAVHSPDGLNLQVYNRCIGTRTCSAYCPYKVRRFNWFDFTHDDPPSIQAARNPDVTVRGRGVMEKCTYCIQRIEAARITAKIEDRPIRDGEVRTACQQACPTDAIIFGDLSDSASAVSRRKASGRDYALLPEANTRPRTTYGARIAGGAQPGGKA